MPGGTLYLVDASVYVFRAWFSMPDTFVNADGQPTHAAYGFSSFITTLLERARPSHIALCFDESLATSFRNEIYPEYKANREPAPEELKRQFAWCRELGESLGIACYSDGRYEADDLIGTLAECARPDGYRVSIVSSDKDLTQLLRPGDELWDFARDRKVDYDGIQERFGVRAEQIADYLALTGDPVDNIPGIPGVGPKTASALLGHFDTLDALLGSIDEVAGLPVRGAKSLTKRLEEHQEAARLARRLTVIQREAACIRPPLDLSWRGPDLDRLAAVCDDLGFGRMLRQRVRVLAEAV